MSLPQTNAHASARTRILASFLHLQALPSIWRFTAELAAAPLEAPDTYGIARPWYCCFFVCILVSGRSLAERLSNPVGVGQFSREELVAQNNLLLGLLRLQGRQVQAPWKTSNSCWESLCQPPRDFVFAIEQMGDIRDSEATTALTHDTRDGCSD